MDLMTCRHCGQPIPRDEWICGECGRQTDRARFHASFGPLFGAALGWAVLFALGLGLGYLLLR